MPSTPSLREKIGQLLMVGFRGSTPDTAALAVRDVAEHGVGAVLLFDQEMADGSRGVRNVVSPEQLRGLTGHLKAAARIPLWVAIDQEGGRVNRLKPEYGFPPSLSQAELGASDDLAATAEHADTMAATLAAAGINFNLAPVVDLAANPSSAIIQGKGRSFSNDPEHVARHAAAVVDAHRRHGVLTCAKHFPGHGSAAGDTHLGFVDVTATWQERELTPFHRLIEGGRCDAAMTAHVFNARLDPDFPASLSHATVTGLLRGGLGFSGIVVTDDLEMRAITDRYGLARAVETAVNAGADLLCFGNNQSYDADIAPKVIDLLARAVATRRVPASRINESFQRILALKQRLVP